MPKLGLIWSLSLVMNEEDWWVTTFLLAFNTFLCSVCKFKFLRQDVGGQKKKKNWLPATGKTKHIPQELTGNSLHSFQWIVLVWWEHNNSYPGDRLGQRQALKNRWKDVLQTFKKQKYDGLCARSLQRNPSTTSCGLNFCVLAFPNGKWNTSFNDVWLIWSSIATS